MKLGERGDPSMAVLHYLREEKGISAEVNLWKRGRGEVREKQITNERCIGLLRTSVIENANV